VPINKVNRWFSDFPEADNDAIQWLENIATITFTNIVILFMKRQ